MPDGAERNRLQLRRIVAATTLAALVVLASVTVLAAFAVKAVDDAQRATETKLIQRRVNRTLEILRENVVSASVWNDAGEAMARRDWAWAQVNFGDYYADYMKHDLTLAFGADGRLAYASRESEQASLDSVRVFAAAVAPLVTEVRSRGATMKQGRRVGLEGVSTREAFIASDGALYAVSAATIVAEDQQHLSKAQFDPVVVSARKMSTVVGELEREVLVQGAGLSPMDAHAGASVDLDGIDGRPLAKITWQPAKPGWNTLADGAPILLLIAGVLIAVCAAAGWRGMGLIKQLEDNETARDLALAKAQEALAAKTLFLANMSHELRTPLNGVIAVGELLRDRQATDESRGMAELIVASARVLERVINDVLDTAKIDAGHMRLEAAPFVLEHLVRDVADLHAAAASQKELRLRWKVSSQAKGAYLGDQTRLAQILSNLLSNAVKFTSAGQVRVTARSGAGGVRFYVSDTGAGFEQNDASRLFRPFEQADTSTTRYHGGTGLGLAICQSLASLMEGRIAVRSAPGRGAVFAITIPMARPNSQGEEDQNPFKAAGHEPRSLRILLAEDHPTNQKVVAMILEPIGAELTIVGDGRAAVEAAASGVFDVILMDIQMPLMDGLEAMTLIRQAERATGQRTPIICLTANAGEIQARACLDAGGDMHVPKPYRAQTLLEAVGRALSNDLGDQT